MINPYYVLKGDMLSILLDYTSNLLNQWSLIPSASQVYLQKQNNTRLTFYLGIGGCLVLFKEHL